MVHSKALGDEELVDYALRAPGMVLINRDIPSLRGAASPSTTARVRRPPPVICWISATAISPS